MPRLYVSASHRTIAYTLDGGGSGYQELPDELATTESEYLAVIYGLNQYFLGWSKELDARQYDMTLESKGEFYKVASPAEETPRPLPPPVLVCSDNEVVVKQLSRQYHIGNSRLRKLAQQVWQMTENVDVKYAWVSRKENLAGKMLK